MDLFEAQAQAKAVQSGLVTIVQVVGVIAGALGLAALAYVWLNPPTSTPVFQAQPAKPGCSTCPPPRTWQLP